MLELYLMTPSPKQKNKFLWLSKKQIVNISEHFPSTSLISLMFLLQ